MRDKRILCYLDDAWHDQLYIGNLNVQNERGREIYSFEWSKKYLEGTTDKLFLDSQIYADTYGRQYAGTHFFGMFYDSCPDRWGRLLMKRREALLAKKEGTTFLVKRFDRRNGKRIHMASAMTMLEKTDNDHDASYLDIADWLSAHSEDAYHFKEAL